MGMFSEDSTYTISIMELIQNNFDFGLDKYSIFDEEYRPILNNAILQYYMFREIGFANPSVFRYKLNERIDRIMRNKYNELYKAKQIEFNPLYNVDMTETYEHTIDNIKDIKNENINNIKADTLNKINNKENNTSSIITKSESSAENLSLSSQYPSEEMTEDDLSENLFVDSANKGKGSDTSKEENNQTSNSIVDSTSATENTENSTSKSNGNENSKTVEKYTRTNIGSSAGLPFSKAMIQLKQYIDQYNLDQQVIDELSDLFMSCW